MSALGKLTNNHSIRVIKDSVRILSSINSPIQVAVTKATREHVKGPPKEKHVRALIAASSNREACREMIEALLLAIHENAWVRALKSLQVIHRLIQEGHETFTISLNAMHVERLLKLTTFRDKTSGKGMDNSPFIRSYADYLIERVKIAVAQPALRQVSRKLAKHLSTKTLCRDATVQDPTSLFSTIKNGQALMDLLLSSTSRDLSDHVLGNSTSLSAFSLLLRDSFGIFKMLADCMILLMDFYFKFDLENAKKAYKLYSKHTEQTNLIIDLYDFTRRIPGIRSDSIPKLKPQPKSILADMKEYIDNGAVSNKDEQNGNSFENNSEYEVDQSREETSEVNRSSNSFIDMFEMNEIPDEDTPTQGDVPKIESNDFDGLINFSSGNVTPGAPSSAPSAPTSQFLPTNSRDSFIQSLNMSWDTFGQQSQRPTISPPVYPPAPNQYQQQQFRSGFQSPQQQFAPQFQPQFQSQFQPQFQPQLQGKNPFASEDAPPPYTPNPFDDPFESGPTQPQPQQQQQQQQQPQQNTSFSALDDFLKF